MRHFYPQNLSAILIHKIYLQFLFAKFIRKRQLEGGRGENLYRSCGRYVADPSFSTIESKLNADLKNLYKYFTERKVLIKKHGG